MDMRICLFFLLFISVATGNPFEDIDFRSPPQRPMYDANNLVASFSEAKSFIEELAQFKKDKKSWMLSLTREDWKEYRQHNRPESYPGKPSMPGADYFWIESAAAWGLSERDACLLNQQKLIVDDREWKQSFQIYTEGIGPIFITSDSLLNGFHRLLESSALQIELSRIGSLRFYLQNLWENLADSVVSNEQQLIEIEEARRYARIFLGVGLSLLGAECVGANTDEIQSIQETLTMIDSNSIGDLPAWMVDSSGEMKLLDYSRFQPASFYARNQKLGGLYKSVKWLQAIPFRIECNKHLLAVNLIFQANRERNPLPSGLEGFLQHPELHPFGNLAGLRIQNLCSIESSEALEGEILETKIALLKNETEESYSPKNDQIRVRLENPEVQFRMFPSFQLPCVKLWNILRGDKPIFSNGNEVLTILGSRLGRVEMENEIPGSVRVYDDHNRKRFLDEIASHSAHFSENERMMISENMPLSYIWKRSENSSPYVQYLTTLGCLFLEPDADAPPFMRSPEWERKSCNTALASWAQMRHALASVTQESALMLYSVDTSPGFVEPNPEFFQKLADTCTTFFEYFLAHGLADNHFDYHESERLQSIIDFIHDHKLLELELSAKDWNDLKRLEHTGLDHTLGALSGFQEWNNEKKVLFSKHVENSDEVILIQPDDFARLVEHIREEKRKLLHSDPPKTYLNEYIFRWTTLIDLARRIEALAHKQLRGHEWTEHETRFLCGFGKQLAFVMGYDGNSYYAPLDDSPRIVVTETDPLTGNYHHIGTTRTRSIYVLYPWKGREILCHGAVIPFAVKNDNRRISDSEWADISKEIHPPEYDSWLEPIAVKPISVLD